MHPQVHHHEGQVGHGNIQDIADNPGPGDNLGAEEALEGFDPAVPGCIDLEELFGAFVAHDGLRIALLGADELDREEGRLEADGALDILHLFSVDQQTSIR